MISNIANSKYPGKIAPDKCKEFGVWYQQYKKEKNGEISSENDLLYILSNLGHFLIKIFMGSGWLMFSEKNTWCYISARFTARSIFWKIATGDISRVAQLSTYSNYFAK